MIVELEASVELAACPFCGSTPQLKAERYGVIKGTTNPDDNHFWVKCPNKECSISTLAFKTKTRAVEVWNKRA